EVVLLSAKLLVSLQPSGQQIFHEPNVINSRPYTELRVQGQHLAVPFSLDGVEVRRVGVGWLDALIRVVEENCLARFTEHPVNFAAAFPVEAQSSARSVERAKVGTEIDPFAQPMRFIDQHDVIMLLYQFRRTYDHSGMEPSDI